jgi:predicted ferric reductase
MTKLQSALSAIIIGTTLGIMVSPASAWWQFVANSPNAQRQVSAHYSSQKSKSALKATEVRLAKKYPDLFPLVGSCEEYR